MALALNGPEIVRSVVDNPTVFTDVREQVQKAALAIVTTQFKCKALDLHKVQAMRDAVGPATFTMLLEHLPDNVLAAVTKKIDPHNPDQKGAVGNWHRKAIDALASGQMSPAEKQARPSTRERSAAPPRRTASRRVTEENFYPKSMGEAVGSRKRR